MERKPACALDVITLSQLHRLRRLGFVVVHGYPTESMLDAADKRLDKEDAHVAALWNSMVGQSIRSQQRAYKGEENAEDNQQADVGLL